MEHRTHTFAQGRCNSMPYRHCSRWGLRLPAISLGAWETFGGYRDETVTRECLFRAFDLGVTHFDLANNYGTPPGNAEIVVGRILKEMPRDELIVSTKAGFRMWPGPYGNGLSRKYLVASLDQSLQRLGLDYVDIYYAHRPDPETPVEETMAALDLLVRQGKALYVGVSNFSGAQLEQAASVVAAMGLSPITVHQPAYNLLGRRCEWDLFDHTQRLGCGVVAFLPLAQGVLTDKYLGGDIPTDSRAAHRWSERHREIALSADTLDKVRRLREMAQARGQSLPQMAIAWVLRHPAVTTALIGASRVEHIEENVGCLKQLEFSDEELRAIDEITPPR